MGDLFWNKLIGAGLGTLLAVFALKTRTLNTLRVVQNRATAIRAHIGALVRLATEKGRQTRPDIKLGVCGEHGGDPVSIGHFHRWGVDYVSCSPPRLPIARLAAAQAALDDR
mgnify:CR=1 FL=1